MDGGQELTLRYSAAVADGALDASACGELAARMGEAAPLAGPPAP